MSCRADRNVESFESIITVSSGISIIIPVFNRAKLLPITLRSLLAQTVPADEIIVVDDGSTDGTAEVAAQFGGTVRVIRQANAGPAAARNRGFRESTGEFIHFFDSDDVALPNKHEIQLTALERDGADIAYGPWVKGSFTKSGFVPENVVLQQNGLPQGNLVKALLTDWSIVPHACLFRRSIVEKSGGFPEDLFVAEDQLMFLNCLLAGAKVVHSPGTLELYRSDNSDKITAASVGRARNFRDWARYLVEAARRCEEKGIRAGSSFGFRRRVWEALEDLDRAGIELPEVRGEFQKMLDGFPTAIYQIARGVERKRLGLQSRLGKGRALACFRTGPMNADQQAAMASWRSTMDFQAERL